MLTDQQKVSFCSAIAAVMNGGSFGGTRYPLTSADQVSYTRDTVADFRAARKSQGTSHPTPFGDVYLWQNVQTLEGLRRGNLFVMDCGEVRAVFFDGELRPATGS